MNLIFFKYYKIVLFLVDVWFLILVHFFTFKLIYLYILNMRLNINKCIEKGWNNRLIKSFNLKFWYYIKEWILKWILNTIESYKTKLLRWNFTHLQCSRFLVDFFLSVSYFLSNYKLTLISSRFFSFLSVPYFWSPWNFRVSLIRKKNSK